MKNYTKPELNIEEINVLDISNTTYPVESGDQEVPWDPSWTSQLGKLN